MSPSGAPEVRITRLTPDDWRRYREIRLAMLRDSPGAFASRYEDVVRRDEETWRQVLTATEHFLAERDGEDMGAAGLTEHEDDLHLIGMYVAPEHRGSPAAARLVQAVLARARERGAPRLLLEVVQGNDRARAFYARCGFTPTGHTQVVPGRTDDLEDEMQLPL